MLYHLVNAGMTLSVLFFSLGYLYRKTMNMHRFWMSAGVLTNVFTAILLIVAIHGFYESDMVAAGFVPAAPGFIITAHRLIALVAFVLMFFMAYTGIKRMRKLHIKLHFIFLFLYSVVYISGLLIFKGA